ncbi:MAG: EF-Tu/IF-2/RF-3 family GTPase, partial [Negativicutes bacterium]|nr:EF-Tu/IF-2/RF-3 family GTPase [Negativicutes bacterium]
GQVKVGETIEIVGMTEKPKSTVVTGVEMFRKLLDSAVAGDNIQMAIELITPIAIEEGLRFAIREGGRTVGAGVVTAINA